MSKIHVKQLNNTIMPIIKKMFDALKKKYGKEKAEDVYYAIENKRKQKTKTIKKQKSKNKK